MQTHDELVIALAQLERAELNAVLDEALRLRGDSPAHDPAGPTTGLDRDAFAGWLAHRHMANDIGIVRVVYLPHGAPEDEVRLLEINRLSNVPDPDVIEPLDFSPDLDGVPYTVFVADITNDQWDRLRAGTGLGLPAGWSLTNAMIMPRG